MFATSKTYPFEILASVASITALVKNDIYSGKSLKITRMKTTRMPPNETAKNRIQLAIHIEYEIEDYQC